MTHCVKINYKQTKATTSARARLKAVFQSGDQGCSGCYLRGAACHEFPCEVVERRDGKNVIWVPRKKQPSTGR